MTKIALFLNKNGAPYPWDASGLWSDPYSNTPFSYGTYYLRYWKKDDFGLARVSNQRWLSDFYNPVRPIVGMDLIGCITEAGLSLDEPKWIPTRDYCMNNGIPVVRIEDIDINDPNTWFLPRAKKASPSKIDIMTITRDICGG